MNTKKYVFIIVENYKMFLYFIFELFSLRINFSGKPRLFAVHSRNITNIGDNINYDLMSKIIKGGVHKSTYLETFFCKNYFFIGSILSFAKKNSIVLGSGFNKESDVNSLKRLPQIKFVRGYLSASLLADKFGLESNSIRVIGDPGLLVSDYYPKAIVVKNRVLLILHHSDSLNDDLKKFVDNNDIDVFNMGQSVLFSDFFLLLTSYKLVISSALHGVIFADSYGIKCIPVRIEKNAKVSEFKFFDYFSISSNRNDCIIYPISNILELSNINQLENFTLPPLINLEQIKIELHKSILTSM